MTSIIKLSNIVTLTLKEEPELDDKIILKYIKNPNIMIETNDKILSIKSEYELLFDMKYIYYHLKINNINMHQPKEVIKNNSKEIKIENIYIYKINLSEQQEIVNMLDEIYKNINIEETSAYMKDYPIFNLLILKKNDEFNEIILLQDSLRRLIDENENLETIKNIENKYLMKNKPDKHYENYGGIILTHYENLMKIVDTITKNNSTINVLVSDVLPDKKVKKKAIIPEALSSTSISVPIDDPPLKNTKSNTKSKSITELKEMKKSVETNLCFVDDFMDYVIKSNKQRHNKEIKIKLDGPINRKDYVAEKIKIIEEEDDTIYDPPLKNTYKN